MATSAESFYGRILPSTLVDYRSKESKTRLCRALSCGTAVPYLAVSSCFNFQAEPAYCGLSTLAILLNALQIDPQRIWRTPWRWYTEELLGCCRPLEDVKKVGITLEEFKCLAECNGATCKLVRPSGLESEQKTDYKQFRKELICVCTGGVSQAEGESELSCCGDEFDEENPSAFIAVSYSRSALFQTGDGHFSPVAALDMETDSALVFDTARFKYPPYWVPIEQLFQAMLALDKATNKPRGFVILRTTRDYLRGGRVCCVWKELDEKEADESLPEPHPVYQKSCPQKCCKT